MSVDPDPSSCSSELVSFNGDYNCSGLALGASYMFIVGASNCVTEEGNQTTFSIEPRGMCIILVSRCMVSNSIKLFS